MRGFFVEFDLWWHAQRVIWLLAVSTLRQSLSPLARITSSDANNSKVPIQKNIQPLGYIEPKSNVQVSLISAAFISLNSQVAGFSQAVIRVFSGASPILMFLNIN